jgi:ABC-type lipoprotein export system ATPase subunit
LSSCQPVSNPVLEQEIPSGNDTAATSEIYYIVKNNNRKKLHDIRTLSGGEQQLP